MTVLSIDLYFQFCVGRPRGGQGGKAWRVERGGAREGVGGRGRGWWVPRGCLDGEGRCVPDVERGQGRVYKLIKCQSRISRPIGRTGTLRDSHNETGYPLLHLTYRLGTARQYRVYTPDLLTRDCPSI